MRPCYVNSAGSPWDMGATEYGAPNSVLFADGFESGSDAAWSD